ncbi:hypothetical protein AV530_002946 [Patagioenas fasciata monilis]|uniref:Importin-7/11-like TPR repeats domain-containing protein n=1 Tax=Patagioenas fasciata monilis TaxID=372326 RepID=A0A1V4J5S7_PATFA|nr:hypothetical protein AV530_002946 [Patagioenas fasciata monilis]
MKPLKWLRCFQCLNCCGNLYSTHHVSVSKAVTLWTSIDILTTVVRNTKPPLSQLLICQAFPAVAQCSLNTDDNATMQNGGECLRAYVSVALEQIAQWHDEQGHNGLWYVMQVVSQLLDPRTSEFTAAFVGRLVSTLISKAGSELGENLDQILRAILSKMQQAETLSVMQVSRLSNQESKYKCQEKKLSLFL